MSDLSGRVALVTGGGRGIGRADCLLLAERGASVVVCDLGVGLDGTGRDASVAETVAGEIGSTGGTALPVVADISTFAGSESAVEEALEGFGRIDILVNNAGISGGAPLDAVNEA